VACQRQQCGQRVHLLGHQQTVLSRHQSQRLSGKIAFEMTHSVSSVCTPPCLSCLTARKVIWPYSSSCNSICNRVCSIPAMLRRRRRRRTRRGRTRRILQSQVNLHSIDSINKQFRRECVLLASRLCCSRFSPLTTRRYPTPNRPDYDCALSASNQSATINVKRVLLSPVGYLLSLTGERTLMIYDQRAGDHSGRRKPT